MDLNINYEETIATGNQVLTQAGEFDSVLGEIMNINGELANMWKGGDSASYTEAVANQAEKMKQLSEVMKMYGSYLVRAGETYRDAMEASKAKFN